MSASLTNLTYDGATYETGPGVEELEFEELQVVEKWLNRPASAWAVQRIGVLQSKIESYTYKIYHRSRYGKHPLAKLIPAHILVQYANEALGFDGWSLEVLDIHVTSCRAVLAQDTAQEQCEPRHEVLTEAKVRVKLKDGTNTESSGFGKAAATSKGESFSRSKKEAVNDAFKKCFLQFEAIILKHEQRVSDNYYVDGLYGSKSKNAPNSRN
ncbi:LANO_0H18514g1_1 [Lachancea nothofagi CBS 11611]|uniref:DNA repair protein RAD59 n=1 Tax=Lachancea nothofagi CBS 11611 TaxID=1266666 RepID=A0A1G4KN91_9SACH|nr:LANO_0H18514g1_1 [Lachancea nothofagi CBS 11611]